MNIMNNDKPPTMAELRNAALDAEAFGRYARAAELFDEAARMYTAQILAVSELASRDCSQLRKRAQECRRSARVAA